MASFSAQASGTIQPCTFVTITTAASNQVQQAANATTYLIGVAQSYADTPPIPGVSVPAAVSGEPIQVYSVGELCLLQASSAGWTAGDRLTSDANGNGITASGTNYYGAIARTTLAAAGLGWVEVVLGKNP